MEVAVDTRNGFSTGSPVEALPRGTLSAVAVLGWPHAFDVDAAGTRFLIMRPVEDPRSVPLHVLQNWFSKFGSSN